MTIFGFAICLTLAVALIHFLAGLGLLPFRQSSESTTRGLQELATARGQGQDFSKLLELGFKPVGSYHEAIMLVGGRDREIVFVHADFPITVYLNQTSSDTISVCMISYDLLGRFVVSTDYDYLELACDTRTLFFQASWFEKLEEVLRDHILALEVWEADGFEAIKLQNVEHAVDQRKAFFHHPQIQGRTKTVLLLASLGILFVGIFVPQIIGSALDGVFKINEGMTDLLMSLVSFGFSAWAIRSMTRSPNPKNWKRPSPPAKPQPERALPTSVNYVRHDFEGNLFQQSIFLNARHLILEKSPSLQAVEIFQWQPSEKISWADVDSIYVVENKNSARLILEKGDVVDPLSKQEIMGIKLVNVKQPASTVTLLDTRSGFTPEQVWELEKEVSQKLQQHRQAAKQAAQTEAPPSPATS